MSAETIRRAAVEDVAAVQGLLAALARGLGEARQFRGTAHDLRRYGFGERPHFEALMAERAGKPVGLVLFFPEFSTWRGRPGVYVQDLFVAPAARGGGLGRRLIEAPALSAAAWDAAYMRLSVHAGNRDAVDFYARLGFQTAEADCTVVAEGDAFAGLGGRGTG